MAKKKNTNADLPAGMSRRQAKLAARAAERAALEGEKRPFAGFAAECDLIALQEFVPSATATVAGTDLTLASMLPQIAARVTPAGRRLASLRLFPQTNRQGATLATQVEWVTAASAGQQLTGIPQPSSTPLAELIDPQAELDITVHEDFRFWFDEEELTDPAAADLVTRASDLIVPSERVDAAIPGAAWWVDAGQKAHIRWVHPGEEDALLDALARIHAAGGLHLGEDSKFAGVFRTHGVAVPVFDLDVTMTAQEWAAGLEALHAAIEEALTVTTPLTAAERSARDTIRSRQVTIR